MNPAWKKGVSGNPSGRPKMSIDFRKLAQSHSETALKKVVEILLGDNKPMEILKAAEIVLDRAYGKCATDGQVMKEELEISEDIKRMSPEELVKELKEFQ